MCFWDLHGGRNLSNYVHQAFSKRLVGTKWVELALFSLLHATLNMGCTRLHMVCQTF
jgi:hypothetical protein